MLNKTYYVCLAGSPDIWDQEVVRRVRGGDSLPTVQVEQWNRGRRSLYLQPASSCYVLHLIPYFEGSLDESVESSIVATVESIDEAIDVGCHWANIDPSRREFCALRSIVCRQFENLLTDHFSDGGKEVNAQELAEFLKRHVLAAEELCELHVAEAGPLLHRLRLAQRILASR